MKRQLKTNPDALQGKEGGGGGFDPTGCRIVYTASQYISTFQVVDTGDRE